MSIDVSKRKSAHARQVQVGDQVRVRRGTWVVAGIEAHDCCTLYTLSPVGSSRAASIHPVRVLAPFDEVVPENRGGGVRRVGLKQWRRACRTLLASSGPAGHLRTAAGARVDLLAYQLEPALALLRGHGCRLLIADDVGLGKTVQAVLAVSELCAAGLARRALVVTPSGLREQWAAECWSRSGIRPTVLDHPRVRQVRATLPPDVNPWSVDPLVVTSIDYVKRPEILPLALAAPWDIVIVDEAHGVATASDRHRAAHALCARATYVLLLTATPHNGDDDAFDRLCGIGRLDGEPPIGSAHGGRPEPLLVFRRTHAEAGRRVSRRIHVLRVSPVAPERAMHGALGELTRAITEEGTDTDPGIWLMLTLLNKRALSGPFALAETAARRLASMHTADTPVACQLPLPVDDESEEDGDEAPGACCGPALADPARERRLLQRIVVCARDAVRHDSKLARLRRLLRAIREPAIVFTEYRDTLLHLQRHAAPCATVLHGGLTARERRSALAAFREHGGVLLATDAAGEGLNLHEHARVVVNLELPWNPMRLEQRIGRVDRIGQTRPVHVFTLVSRRTGEEALLQRLATRVARAKARVGAADPLQVRSAWTEDASARVVMRARTDDEAGARHVDEAAPQPGPTPAVEAVDAVTIVRFSEDAALEARRLRLVRALLTVARLPFGSAADPAGGIPVAPALGASPLIACCTRARTRMALNGQALAVLRSAMSDADGDVVASCVSGALLRASFDDVMSAEGLRAFADAVDAAAAGGEWLAGARLVRTRMRDTLVRRVRSITRHIASEPGLRQPGLFDRRLEHILAVEADVRVELERNLDARLRRADAAADIRLSPTEVLLLLLPMPAGRRCRATSGAR